MTPRLPSPDQRGWLTSHLTELVARAGWPQFVRAPLIEPTDTFFPDRYEHGPRGVRTVARRFLRHAGIDDLVVHVESHLLHEDEREESLLPKTEIDVTSVAEGHLDLALHDLGAPEDVVPILSHRIALAYRRHRRLDRAAASAYRGAPEDLASDDDPELEEALASIAEVYLGFGIIAANGAQRYRAAGRTENRMVRTEWSHDRAGGLEAHDVVFLFALQLVVRGVDDTEIARIRRLLSPNQSGDLAAWIDALRDHVDELRAGLSIPARSEWPAASIVDSSPLEQDDEEDGEALEDEPIDRAALRAIRNAGRKVFRVRRTRAIRTGVWAATGALVSLGGAAYAGIFLGPAGLALPLAGFSIGAFFGRRVRCDVCSDPDCERALALDATTCPGCGGTVSGEIASAAERLGAEEEIEARERAERRRRQAKRATPSEPGAGPQER